MYVLDSGNDRIQVFAADGSFARSIGREGQGPGEFTSGMELEIAGDRVLLWDGDKRRMVTWDLEGNPGDEIILEGVRVVIDLDVAGDSSLLVTHTHVPGPLETGARLDFVVQLFGTDGSAGPVLLQLPSIWPTSDGAPRPVSAASVAGDVYVAPGAEYQVHAFTDEGEPEWAIRMNWPRRSTAADRERALEWMQEQYPQFSSEERTRRAALIYPRDYHDALGGIYVDGHGHVYVRPSFQDLEQRKALGEAIANDYAWPFDVYTGAGEHLYSGCAVRSTWLESRGDYVYYLSTDLDTEERILVRARLVEPF